MIGLILAATIIPQAFIFTGGIIFYRTVMPFLGLIDASRR